MKFCRSFQMVWGIHRGGMREGASTAAWHCSVRQPRRGIQNPVESTAGTTGQAGSLVRGRWPFSGFVQSKFQVHASRVDANRTRAPNRVECRLPPARHWGSILGSRCAWKYSETNGSTSKKIQAHNSGYYFRGFTDLLKPTHANPCLRESIHLSYSRDLKTQSLLFNLQRTKHYTPGT